MSDNLPPLSEEMRALIDDVLFPIPRLDDAEDVEAVRVAVAALETAIRALLADRDFAVESFAHWIWEGLPTPETRSWEAARQHYINLVKCGMEIRRLAEAAARTALPPEPRT